LRARKSDLHRLINFLLKQSTPSRAQFILSEEAERKLLNHDWPGNVRELRGVLNRSLILRQGPRIEACDIVFDRERLISISKLPRKSPMSDSLESVQITGRTLEEIEREAIIKMCQQMGATGQVDSIKLATELGLSRATLFRRLKEYEVKLSEFGDKAS
jgi:DNA-binding NtrC family response regulator